MRSAEFLGLGSTPAYERRLLRRGRFQKMARKRSPAACGGNEVVSDLDRPTDSHFAGTWRIVEMEVWDRDYIDMEVPAFIRFEEEQLGEFQFGLVRGFLDCRYGERDHRPLVEFSWEGTDDLDDRCGRGWAVIERDQMVGRFYLHRGDDSEFRATRAKAKPTEGAKPVKPRTRSRP